MGLCRTVSEINGDFSRKSQNFPTPFFAPPLTGAQKMEYPLQLGIGTVGHKTRMMGLPDGRKSFKVRLNTIPAYDGQTDGHRTTAKTALCRASRGCKTSWLLEITVEYSWNITACTSQVTGNVTKVCGEVGTFIFFFWRQVSSGYCIPKIV